MPTTHTLITAAAFIAEFAVRLCMVGVILLRRRPKPTATTAWVILILALPLVGVIAYLLIGSVRFGKYRTRRHREIVRRVEERACGATGAADAAYDALPETQQALSRLAETVGQSPARRGNALRLLSDTEMLGQSLVEDIDAATSHCHLLFYIFLDDHMGERIAEALIRAAGRGVECRLLVDAVGSNEFARSSLRRVLERAGVQVVEALPANMVRMLFARVDIRNHRKIVVIDGTVGYTGSHNLADAEFAIKPKFGPWVDATIRIEGPVTRDLQILFIEDWYLDTDESLERLLLDVPAPHASGVPVQVMGSGPSSFNEALRQLHQAAFHAAKRELILTTPYFVPDEAMVSALATAARRGVETNLVLPARNDSPLIAAASRSHYERLLEAGVQIFEFGHGLLHAKTMTIDREFALLGSANIDRRSFEINFEVGVMVFDSDFASQVRFLQTSYLADSRPVSRSAWKRRAWPRRLVENAAGTFSPLL